MSDRENLLTEIKGKAVVHGKVTLSSGKEADYYVDLRRATLHHEAAPLIGRAILALTADWAYDAVGGLTLGADPVAAAVLHAAAAGGGPPVDAFVVRKAAKEHGMGRRMEGPDVAGRGVPAGLRQVAGGGQAYWVCPLVEESETSDLAAASRHLNQLGWGARRIDVVASFRRRARRRPGSYG